ncbi:hypothetical protein PPL_09502 [Heterostelium album PN500]|uniref:La-related protein 7 n=1 Tax=Heterostelium pallidum (strain ATCC 26659 / Pp 5 / PN500) TaxID=670386 RepID=D3BN91_HETP5|nr:hypothetical protein PPL_09502 [Heterostelium album PN500]EFA76751.1 hypothetical protein PPL_09502 [Heterostelium album PN500]|eukprot:XP_020428883.1 hypothetical protein PPL_09502 [Heterostelium album PN500]
MNIQIDDVQVNSIVEQLEYYFSDSNLLKDKYMNKQVHHSNDGWIGIDILLTFNKLHLMLEKVLNEHIKAKQNDISVKDVLITILLHNRFKESQLLVANDEANEIKRRHPFIASDDLIRTVDEKTIYIEPVPENMTNEELIALFSELGSIENVSIPRFPDKRAKGFAFIEFKEKENAINAITSIRSNKEKYKLRTLSKIDWLNKKKQIVDAYQHQHHEQHHEVVDQGGYHYNNNRRNNDNFKNSNNNNNSGENNNESIGKRILKIDNIPLTTNKPFLWKQLDQFFHTVFLDYHLGGGYAVLRFKSMQERDSAQEMVKSGKVIIDEQVVTTSLLTDHEFKTHMNKSSRYQHQKQQEHDNEVRMQQYEEDQRKLKSQKNKEKKKRKKEKQKNKIQQNNNNNNDNTTDNKKDNSIVNFDSDNEDEEMTDCTTKDNSNNHKRSFTETLDEKDIVSNDINKSQRI